MDYMQESESSRRPSLNSGEVKTHVLFSETSPLLDSQEKLRRRIGAGQDSEESVHGTPETKTFSSRFWILFWFAVITANQVTQWNSWGPINESVQTAYPEWKPSTIAITTNWGNIVAVLFVLPICWFCHRYGLRTGTLLCAGLVAVGTALRCIPVSDHIFLILCNLCGISVGLAAPFLTALAPMLAATWFPPKERTTALAVLQTSGHFGILVSYFEPMVVRAPGGNVTQSDIKEDIIHLMRIDAMATAGMFLFVLLYFPDKPKLPPSVTSSREQLEFIPSLKGLVRNKSVWLITISYSVTEGTPSAWMGVLNFSLLPLGIHEDEAMLIGVVAILTSTMSPLITGRLTDYIYGYVRLSIMLLLVGATASFYWFYLLSNQTIATHKWEVYASTSLGLMCLYGCLPLFVELAVEIAYPCPEVIVGGFLTAFKCSISTLVLLIFSVPNIGYQWFIYVILSSCSLMLIPLLMLNESYGRSTVDRADLKKSSSQDPEPPVPDQVFC